MTDLSTGGFEVRCAQCHTRIDEGQPQRQTEEGVFCSTCYDELAASVRSAIGAQSEDINYPLALVGGLAGGALGGAVWWGFTVATNIAFGLIAIVIGIAVGKGIVMLSGKRAVSLQVMAVVISVFSYFSATYLVTRSFVNDSPEAVSEGFVLPFIPDPELAFAVISNNFEMFDLLFLGIVVWEAWRVTAPIRLD